MREYIDPLLTQIFVYIIDSNLIDEADSQFPWLIECRVASITGLGSNLDLIEGQIWI